MNEFDRRVSSGPREGLYARTLETLQVNLGAACNQSCAHCHLEASPTSEQAMPREVMDQVVRTARVHRPRLVDVTGGAPELNPDFVPFVMALSGAGLSVQVHTNLTVLTEEGHYCLPEFFRQRRVALVASLPCYQRENVDNQRGSGTMRRSIEALRRLNAVGFGVKPDLRLDLVYNPGLDSLPPDQSALEKRYRKELLERYGVRFSSLRTMTNMPIGRFASYLKGRERYKAYMSLLADSFNPCTVDNLMCRSQVSVGPDGTLYDCDFNLALGTATDHGAPGHIGRFDGDALAARRIVTGLHCFGCTAGNGSSCAGALV